MNPIHPLKNPLSNVFTPAESPLELLPESMDHAPQRQAGRTKLWALADKHHCPVVGTCLSVHELTKFARRFFCAADPRNEYAMHVEAVKRVCTRNPLSEAIQKHLERKYRLYILGFERAQTDTEVFAMWREYYARGEVAGALWAAVTHKAIGAESEQRIFADVHMLSHQVGAGQAADNRRLSLLEKANVAAKNALEAQKKRQAGSEAKLRQQLLKVTEERDSLRSLRDEMSKLQARLEAFESGSVILELGRKILSLQNANDELMASTQRMWSLEKNLKVAHEEALSLARERDQLAAERDALQRLLGADDTDVGDENGCEGECATCELSAAKGCVLYVGGRPSLMAQYRALAERLGIRLIHHDGGVEESLSRLPDMINGADAVICPTDCVSHSAYYQLKRQCKRSGKPCLLFKGAGVSGFAVALARLSAGQTTLSNTTLNFA